MTNAVITAQQGSPFNNAGYKNRIINGAMEIDQRNSGAAVAYYSLGAAYRTVDRFLLFSNNINITGTLQQVVDAPPGFYNSLKVSITVADAGTTVTRGHLEQRIEGYNFHDSGYGTSAAQPFTLSFWVKSNISGTYSGCWQFYNNGLPYSYPYTYTINASNTWEYKTITIPGNTAYSCPTTTGLAMEIFWDLSNGSTLKGPANGTWQQADYRGATGGVNLGGIAGSTWQVTGVQVEEGNIATSFERRNYATELVMCQRYFIRMQASGIEFYPLMMTGGYTFPSNWYKWVTRALPVVMRAAPTLTVYPEPGSTANPGQAKYFTGNQSGAGNNYTIYGSGTTVDTVKIAVYNEHNAITCYGVGCWFDALAEI